MKSIIFLLLIFLNFGLGIEYFANNIWYNSEQYPVATYANINGIKFNHSEIDYQCESAKGFISWYSLNQENCQTVAKKYNPLKCKKNAHAYDAIECDNNDMTININIKIEKIKCDPIKNSNLLINMNKCSILYKIYPSFLWNELIVFFIILVIIILFEALNISKKNYPIIYWNFVILILLIFGLLEIGFLYSCIVTLSYLNEKINLSFLTIIIYSLILQTIILFSFPFLRYQIINLFHKKNEQLIKFNELILK